MGKQRFLHWDALRGLVVILMMLDHTRHFFAVVPFDPTDPSQTTWGWFLTRWMTHFCAPVFVFLAGAGIAMSSKKGMDLLKYLWVRGALLMVLEVTWVNIAWGLWAESMSVLQVIWALGAAMIVMGVLAQLSRPFVLLLAVFFLGIQYTDPSFLTDYQIRFLFYPELFFFEFWKVQVYYPLMPWLSLMMMGWVCGKQPWMHSSSALMVLGSVLCLIFFSGRLWGVAQGWVTGESFSQLLLAILNCQKYPPSFSYLLMTMGPALMVLGAFVGRRDLGTRFLVNVGKWPMFFYLVHLPVLSLASHVLSWRSHADELFGLYGVWVFLLPPCLFLTYRLGRIKSSYPKSFLRYF